MEFFGNYNLNFLIIRNFLDNKEILFRVHKKKKDYGLYLNIALPQMSWIKINQKTIHHADANRCDRLKNTREY